MANFVTLLTPANNSGVLGLSRLSLDGNTLTVDVATAGLTPGQVHPFPLHGFLDDRPERLSVAADDADGDGFVETPEGETAAFGPVIAGLTASGNAAFGLGVSPDFPTADANGNLTFSQRYILNPMDPDDGQILARVQARLEGRVLEFHGLDLPAGAGTGTGNEVNGTPGYNAAVPVSQGQLYEVPATLDLVPGVGLAVPGWLSGDSAGFLAKASALLTLLAPYTLNPAGTGPIAQEPPGAQTTTATDTFAALLQPSNGSGVLGIAGVQIDRTNATVEVDLWATGLTPNEAHTSHIHGFADDRPSLLPNYRLDADRDGFVEDPEGVGVVGPIILALTEDGSISNAVLPDAVTRADAGGNLQIHESYRFNTADPAQAAIFQDLQDRLIGREVQIHGLPVPATEGEGTQGEVNGVAGYKPDLPVANGILLPLDTVLSTLDLTDAAPVVTALLAAPSVTDALLI